MDINNLKLAIDNESVGIYFDRGEEFDPITIFYSCDEDWSRRPMDALLVAKIVDLFHTNRQKLLEELNFNPEFLIVNEFMETEGIDYINNWDDLMDVIIIIESLGYQFNIIGNHAAVTDEMSAVVAGPCELENSKIKNCYAAIVEFVKYYNSKKDGKGNWKQ